MKLNKIQNTDADIILITDQILYISLNYSIIIQHAYDGFIYKSIWIPLTKKLT